MELVDFTLVWPGQGRALLGESPVWDPATNAIWWVDIEGRAVLKTNPVTAQTDRWSTPECPGFVALTGPDQPVIGMETGIFAFDPVGWSFQKLVTFDQDGCRFNDATVDASGQLWVSTMAMDAKPGQAAIHRVTADLSLRPVVTGLTIPNGLAVDPVRNRLYWSDSHRDSQRIWHSNLSAGTPAVFASTKACNGRPDGAAIDRRGCYWIAGVDGGEVYVFDPDGTLSTTIPLPFPAPTKVAFFGPDGRRIAITSKDVGEQGGALALAAIPAGMSGGLVQPYWTPGASERPTDMDGR
jgi:xylono-1,5-lactonase